MSYRPASLALLVALGLSACSEPASTPPVEEQDSVAEAEADEPTERERMLRIMSPDEVDALEGERGLRLAFPQAMVTLPGIPEVSSLNAVRRQRRARDRQRSMTEAAPTVCKRLNT